MSRIMIVLAAGALILSLLLCSYASYVGFGVTPIGPRHLRSGSVLGPGVRGGGPGVGK